VPGLTAAQAVASRVGAPLGHDFCVVSLSDRLKPWAGIAERLTAAGAPALGVAIHNPASRSRVTQLAEARRLLLAELGPETVVVVGRDVGGPDETVRVTTLGELDPAPGAMRCLLVAGGGEPFGVPPPGELDPATVDMRCLLIVGSSRTRAVSRADGGTFVYTPRTY